MQHDELECRVGRALRANVSSPADATRERIMTRIRAMSAGERPRRGPRWNRGANFRASVAGAALAAGIGSVGALQVLVAGADARPRGTLATAVIGDTVGATLRDTMRLVRLMFVDSAAHEVAVVGSFEGWQPDSTPLTRATTRSRWSVTLALHDREPRFAVVVDGARFTLSRATPSPDRGGEQLYTLLRIAPVAN